MKIFWPKRAATNISTISSLPQMPRAVEAHPHPEGVPSLTPGIARGSGDLVLRESEATRLRGSLDLELHTNPNRVTKWVLTINGRKQP
jgi:hypothetical protein